MFKILETQKYPVVALLLGFLLILVGVADIQEIQKMKLTLRADFEYTLIIIGGGLLVLSFIIQIVDNPNNKLFFWGRVKRNEHGFHINVNEVTVNVVFGRIEEKSDSFSDSAIVLPANEFFDDDCIDDKKSALGAYINSKFLNQVEQVKDRIKNELINCKKIEIEKENGIFKDSYGVGKALLIKNILGSSQPVVLLAVTTKRAGEGLRSELSYIHEALKQLFAVTADARIASVCLPILGSGHGGLKKEIALFGLIMALLEMITSPSGKHMKTVNIIVFRDTVTSMPEIKESTVKKLLSLSAGIFLK